MDSNKISAIIIIIAIVVMTIWGFTGICGGWQYSWIAMFVGVMATVIVKIIDGKK
ncbi:MAG: hypothetical protein Q4G47_00525 [Lachnospiraceae bacterium]|nr:hypothetical protein [Lachnospiraceae bacterium]